jgi:hypothetical protein
MRPARIVVCFVLLLFCVSTVLPARSRRITVTGKLTRALEIGADSSGWSLNLNPVLEFDGRQFSAVDVHCSHPQKLENLDEEFVRATGTLTYSTGPGPDSAQRPVLALSSIKEIKDSAKSK